MAKNVSLGKILAELKAAISELEKEDPTWSDHQKKKAKSSARVLKNLHELVSNDCTDGSQMVPGA